MMGTMFIQQGTLMDNRVTLPGSSFTLRIPAATMALFNTGAIILLVPLYDTVFEPALKRCGVRWTLLRRIGEGAACWPTAMQHRARLGTLCVWPATATAHSVSVWQPLRQLLLRVLSRASMLVCLV